MCVGPLVKPKADALSAPAPKAPDPSAIFGLRIMPKKTAVPDLTIPYTGS